MFLQKGETVKKMREEVGIFQKAPLKQLNNNNVYTTIQVIIWCIKSTINI